MNKINKQILVFLLFFWLKSFTVYSAVLWLEIGAASMPALTEDGNVISPTDLAALEFEVNGSNTIEVDISGLDEVGSGYFYGVIHISSNGAQPLAQPITIAVIDPSTDKRAELGSGPAVVDDFTPFVDPAQYLISTPVLDWLGKVRLTTAVVGPGKIAPKRGTFLENTEIVLTSTPATDQYIFIEWSGDVPVQDRHSEPLTLVMDQDRHVVARFDVIVDEAWLIHYFGTTDVDLEADADGDGLSNRQEFKFGTDPQVDAADEIFSVDIVTDWNLLSLPLQPPPGIGFDDLFPNLPSLKIWRWDASIQDFRSADQVRAKVGWWIHSMESEAGILVSGHAVVDFTVSVFPGWNLIGSVEESAPPDVIKRTIWHWDQTLQQYHDLKDGEMMQPGKGYWVYSESKALLEFGQ